MQGCRSTTENQINAMPRDQVQDGGRLVWPVTLIPVTYNYNHLDGGEVDSTYIMFPLMPRIFLYDAGGAPSGIPTTSPPNRRSSPNRNRS